MTWQLFESTSVRREPSCTTAARTPGTLVAEKWTSLSGLQTGCPIDLVTEIA